MGIKCVDFGVNPFDADFEIVESATLQCCSLKTGANKFYQMELHRGKTSGKWRVFTANGRTGVYSKPRERMTNDETKARAEYAKIYKTKTTRNKEPYRKVEMVSSKMGTDEGNQRLQSDDFNKDKVITSGCKKCTGSAIPSGIKVLINRLYQEAGQACQSQLHGSLNTTAENPLGTLTLTQIEEGKSIIQEINATLVKDKSLVDSIEPEIISLTDAFYSTIPQAIALRPKIAAGESARDEWMREIALNNPDMLDEKFDLLDLLGDIKGMIVGFSTTDEHTRLKEANCDFQEVDSSTFRRVRDFAHNSQSRHHSWKITVKKVWKIASKAQTSHQKKIDQIGNANELFHGSRAANIIGICKKGLLQRPPGGYVTGSMFGSNAVYFASQSTKSSQYATARYGGAGSSHGSTAFMFVANVALGRIKRYGTAQTHLTTPPRGYDSVQGVRSSDWKSGYGSLVHDEFMIYDVKQHELAYLMEFTQRH